WPDPSDARTIAQWLIKADNPVICTSKSGHNPASVPELVRLAELLAVPVMEVTQMDRLNFPTTHPLYGSGPMPHEADVLLVIESPTPFLPSHTSARADAKVAWIDIDPVMSRYKTLDYEADLWIPADTASTLRAIFEAATAMLTQSDMNRILDRRVRLEQKKQEQNAAAERAAVAAGKRRQLHPRWVAYELG